MGETVNRDGVVYAVKKTYNQKTGGITKTLVPVGRVAAEPEAPPEDAPLVEAAADAEAEPAKTGKFAKAKAKRRKKK